MEKVLSIYLHHYKYLTIFMKKVCPLRMTGQGCSMSCTNSYMDVLWTLAFSMQRKSTSLTLNTFSLTRDMMHVESAISAFCN